MDHQSRETWRGVIIEIEETLLKGIAGLACKVLNNAPRGYSRVYVWNSKNKMWVGPHIVFSEFVKITE